MAKTASPTSNLIPTFWSVLLLICVGLVLGHLITAVQSETGPEADLMDRTFTTIQTNR